MTELEYWCKKENIVINEDLQERFGEPATESEAAGADDGGEARLDEGLDYSLYRIVEEGCFKVSGTGFGVGHDVVRAHECVLSENRFKTEFPEHF